MTTSLQFRVLRQDFMYNEKYFCYKRSAYEHEKCGPFSLGHWHELGRAGGEWSI